MLQGSATFASNSADIHTIVAWINGWMVEKASSPQTWGPSGTCSGRESQQPRESDHQPTFGGYLHAGNKAAA